MIVDNLLSRLDKVKKTGSSQWVACCPAHGSEGRKLAISEGDDGRILLKCWSRNCHPTEIVDSVLRPALYGPKTADLYQFNLGRSVFTVINYYGTKSGIHSESSWRLAAVWLKRVKGGFLRGPKEAP